MKKKNQLQLFEVEPIEKQSACAGGFPQKQLENTLISIHKGIGTERVFSNSTDADRWMYHNCNRCAVPNGNNERVKRGLDCIGEYAVAAGFITGSIPESVVTHFGIDKLRCKQFK
jgi:hypothetical protein